MWRSLLIGCFVLLLSACTANRPAATPEYSSAQTAKLQASWEQHQAKITPIQHWELNGKVAVNSGKTGGTATVIWKQYVNGYDLEFYGILGQGRTRLRSTAQETRLYTAEGPQWVAANAQSLLGEYTGWYLPVDNMFYWVRGLPSPDQPVQSLFITKEGRLQQLQQAGWTITYEEYLQVNGRWLPKRFKLTHPGNSLHPAITVKWLSKSWLIAD